MNSLETILMCAAMLVLVFCAVLTPVFVYYRLVSKGYNPALTLALVTLLALLSEFVPMAIGLPLQGKGSGPMRPAQLLLFIGPLVVLPPLVLLPVRVRRRWGARRSAVPFRLFGILLFALAALWCWSIWQDGRPDRLQALVEAIKVGIALGGLGLLMFWYARRLRGRSLDEALVTDPRQPVLYLRAFMRDNDVFLPDAPDSLEHLKCGPMARVNRLLIVLSGSGNPSFDLTFEEFFADELQRRVGPFVALGSPQDYLPPVGAVRAYARDSDWQQKLAGLAEAACLIVMEPGGSANVAWELDFLAQSGTFRKLVIVTQPQAANLSRWNFKFHWVRFVRWARQICITPWPEFAAAMARHGYALDTNAPPIGSVVAFDEQRRGVLLASGAAQPSDYVDAIVDWLPRLLSPADGDGTWRNSKASCAG